MKIMKIDFGGFHHRYPSAHLQVNHLKSIYETSYHSILFNGCLEWRIGHLSCFLFSLTSCRSIGAWWFGFLESPFVKGIVT